MAGMERDPLLGVLSTNPFAIGATVYGNGTQAPTSGPVDISGYRERDLKKRRQQAMNAATQAAMRSGGIGGGITPITRGTI